MSLLAFDPSQLGQLHVDGLLTIGILCRFAASAGDIAESQKHPKVAEMAKVVAKVLKESEEAKQTVSKTERCEKSWNINLTEREKAFGAALKAEIYILKKSCFITSKGGLSLPIMALSATLVALRCKELAKRRPKGVKPAKIIGTNPKSFYSSLEGTNFRMVFRGYIDPFSGGTYWTLRAHLNPLNQKRTHKRT